MTTFAAIVTLILLLVALAYTIARRPTPRIEAPRIGAPPLPPELARRAHKRREERYLACASTAQQVAYHDADPRERARILRAWRLAQECSAIERKRAALELPPTERGN